MPQFIHAVPKTQAIFLEASATLPKSSLYSNKALFSEQILHKAFRSNSEVWIQKLRGWKEGRRCNQGPREGGCEDEAWRGGPHKFQCWANFPAREEDKLLGLLIWRAKADHQRGRWSDGDIRLWKGNWKAGDIPPNLKNIKMLQPRLNM